MKLLALILFLLTCNNMHAQQVAERLSKAIRLLEHDLQVKHATVSLYVVNTKTGQVVFEKNSEVGLAPASCQKVVTSTAAFTLLGKNFRYTTKLAYTGKIEQGALNGNIAIIGSGDPTLGSWRYPSTHEAIVLANFEKACREIIPNGINGFVCTNSGWWGENSIPDGWIWQDIGNYYGAGASILNWRENQYDIILKSGKRIGDSVIILGTNPGNLYGISFKDELTSAAEGSGDNGYIYLAPQTFKGYLSGTIPIKENHFIISGTLPDAAGLLRKSLQEKLNVKEPIAQQSSLDSAHLTYFYSHQSPPLDSINYWFLKKSINLYGEALLKTMAHEVTSYGTTDSGVSVIRKFWASRGIELSSLKIIDGSGLSPGNRVTTHALVSVLQYAKDQPWFSSFYYDLPESNGIKMKDGYINGVRSYTGYIKARDGNQYTFSFIVNNFDGSPSSIREKMWKLLDIMK